MADTTRDVRYLAQDDGAIIYALHTDRVSVRERVRQASRVRECEARPSDMRLLQQ